MSDYVYALHEFAPEHEDELAFHPGDRIQILERDEVYGDGWWQGRTEDGRVGLFPESYTTSKPPPDSPTSSPQQPSPPFQPVPDIRLSGGLVPLEEESEEFHDAHTRQPNGDNAVMQATMTDVQHAIDQLAVKNRDDADRRTFSFASTRDTETDREEDDDPDDKEWHKDTRSRLAENAQRVNETLEATHPANASHERIAPPIPLEMSDESEDEYDLDDAHHTHHSSVPPTARANDTTFPQNIPAGQDSNPAGKLNGNITTNNASKGDLAHVLGVHRTHSPVDFSPAMARSELDPEDAIDASHSSAPVPPVPPLPASSVSQVQKAPSEVPSHSTTSLDTRSQHAASEHHRANLLSSTSLPTPVSPIDVFHPVPSSATAHKFEQVYEPKPTLLPAATIASPTPTKSASPFVVQNLNEIASNPFPSPAASIARKASSVKALNGVVATPSPTVSAAMAAAPAPSTPLLQMTSNVGSAMSGPLSAAPSTSGFSARSMNFAAVHPSEWTQPQVVDWLKSKGFDESIWSKFIEHEIDGEVLLQLDLAMLKEEMGIVALGKRMRLANAISELRRPPSVDTSSSGHIVAGVNSANAGSGYLHTTEQQYANSMPSHTTQPHERHISHGSSIALSSVNSPIAPSYSTGNSASVITTNTTVMSPNLIVSSPSGDMAPNGNVVDDNNLSTQAMKYSKSEGADKKKIGLVGLGIASAGMATAASVGPGVNLPNGRPASLSLSPSDSALASRTLWGQGPKTNESADQKRHSLDKSDDDRAVLSEGEHSFLAKKQSTKRKAVRTSFASSDKDTDTKSSSLPGSPSVRSSTFGHSRTKKSVDTNGNTKSHDRLSFFGGSLGKGRKPAPSTNSELSDSATASTSTDKPTRSLSRLYLGSGNHKRAQLPAPQHRIAPPAANSISPPAPRSPERLKRHMLFTSDKGSSPTQPKAFSPRSVSSPADVSHPPHTRLTTHQPPQPPPELGPGATALEKIGEPDYAGWMRKRGERYNAWKLRYFVLKGQHLYYVKSLTEEKIKGYIDIAGYKVIADENVHPGRYGFRIIHEVEKPHYFSSVEQSIVREWMKALMKATIGRDYSRPVVSSCNIPTIPLSVAQAMNPAPRPPSPSARAATQKAMRRENVNQLSNRDALILMGMGGEPDATDRARLDQFFNKHADAMNGAGLARSNSMATAPPRPAREVRKRPSTASSINASSAVENSSSDIELINWINSNLPPTTPPATDLSHSLSTGLILYRLAESIKGVPTDVPDSAFPTAADQEKLEGLFKLFDFLLDNDVRMGSVSINDVRTGNRDKISQLVKSLKSWQEKRVSLSKSVTSKALSAGPWLAVGH